MPKTDQNGRERSRSFYARISAANIAHGSHAWPGSPSTGRRTPPRPHLREHAPWTALRIVGVAVLVHGAGWTLLLATKGQSPAVGLVMAAWFGAAFWAGVRARTWWWPAMSGVAPVVVAGLIEWWARDPDPDVAWALLLLAALLGASSVPLAGAVIGVLVGKVACARDGKRAQRRA